MAYFETSAQSGANVREMFLSLFVSALAMAQGDQDLIPVVKPRYNEKDLAEVQRCADLALSNPWARLQLSVDHALEYWLPSVLQRAPRDYLLSNGLACSTDLAYLFVRIGCRVLQAGNCYERLGIPLRSGREEINKAYKRIAAMVRKSGCCSNSAAFRLWAHPTICLLRCIQIKIPPLRAKRRSNFSYAPSSLGSRLHAAFVGRFSLTMDCPLVPRSFARWLPAPLR